MRRLTHRSLVLAPVALAAAVFSVALSSMALFSMAGASVNDPLVFELQPANFHAYQDDPPQPLTVTLQVHNPTRAPVALTCQATSAPVLRRFTEFQDGQASHLDEWVGPLTPQPGSPTCGAVGQVLTLPAGATWRYTRNLGVQKRGAQVHYRAAWNVSLRPGRSWLQYAYATALVVAQNRPVPTPTPAAYHDALDASGAMWLSRSSRSSPPEARLSFSLADEWSHQAFLAELNRRGLDARQVDIEVIPPVAFSQSAEPHRVAVTVQPTAQGYTFTLALTNTGKSTLKVNRRTCEPFAVERLPGGQRIYQLGNGPCVAMALSPVLLAPGETFTQTVKWEGRTSTRQAVPAGAYRVKIGVGQFTAQAEFTVR